MPAVPARRKADMSKSPKGSQNLPWKDFSNLTFVTPSTFTSLLCFLPRVLSRSVASKVVGLLEQLRTPSLGEVAPQQVEVGCADHPVVIEVRPQVARSPERVLQ